MASLVRVAALPEAADATPLLLTQRQPSGQAAVYVRRSPAANTGQRFVFGAGVVLQAAAGEPMAAAELDEALLVLGRELWAGRDVTAAIVGAADHRLLLSITGSGN